jgi:Predicted DNA binding protein
MSGVRTKLAIDNPADCPVANASTEAAGPVTKVSWTDAGATSDATEQFTAPDAGPQFDEVFDYGSRQVYEFERQANGCVCEQLEASVGPVTEVYAETGRLHVTLYAADTQRLRQTVQQLSDAYDSVRLEYLVRSWADDADADLVPVDLRQLTDRQREVLATAHEMGYFEYPRAVNATEVATALEISRSTFTEHLNTAQSKLLDELLG